MEDLRPSTKTQDSSSTLCRNIFRMTVPMLTQQLSKLLHSSVCLAKRKLPKQLKALLGFYGRLFCTWSNKSPTSIFGKVDLLVCSSPSNVCLLTIWTPLIQTLNEFGALRIGPNYPCLALRCERHGTEGPGPNGQKVSQLHFLNEPHTHRGNGLI